MSVLPAFDLLLCAMVLATALLAVTGRSLFGGLVSFIVYGLLLSLAWVRLGAVDVALAEAAIGAGLTGVLLLSVTARLRRPEKVDSPPTNARASVGVARPIAAALCVGIAVGLVATLAHLPDPPPGLAPAVAARLEDTGVTNPVTAVLLVYRGYDTLLETVVLLLALLGIWSLTPDALWGGRPGLRHVARPDGVLAFLGRLLPPVGLVVGVYLVWIGSSAPGGAFQAATVLAAVWLLAVMAGLFPTPAVSEPRVRLALVVGPLLFLAVGVAGLILAGTFLYFPPAAAKALILLIEAGLTLSIAATLGLVVAGPPEQPA